MHRSVALGLALVAVLLTSHFARAEEDAPTIVTVLHPGWNLIGWVEEATPVERLFEAVPQIERAYAWDSLDQRWLVAFPRAGLGNLRTLLPGMGLRVVVSGDVAVEWKRPRGEYVDQTPIRPGWNLVAWQGLDHVPSPVALRQVRAAVDLAILLGSSSGALVAG